jgi:predicted metal-dependent hydrolase
MIMLPKQDDLASGVELFNRAHFFDAHEALEDVWRALDRDGPHDRPLRRHVQGLVQLAVAFHHESKGNYVGARSVLERAVRNLEGADGSFPDLDLDQLRAELADWSKHLSGAALRPMNPQIVKRTPPAKMSFE